MSMTSRMVVGLDATEVARNALDWAVALSAQQSDPELHLIHSYYVLLPVQGFQEERVLAVGTARGQAMLAEAVRGVNGVRVESHLSDQPPAEAVLALAEKLQADLIVVGCRGRGPAARFFAGSTSAEVVHGARVPVLVAHGGPARPVRKVLVGVDGSDHSVRALGAAVRWAPQAEITAMHVLNLTPEVQAAFADVDVALSAVANRTGQDVVDRVVKAAGLQGQVKALAGMGHPADALVAAYASGGYDLAVLGSRGMGSLAELLIGSVSERVLRLATGPVMVVK